MPHEHVEPDDNAKAVAGAAAESPHAHTLFMLDCALTNLSDASESLDHMGWRFWIGSATKDIENLIKIIKGRDT